MRGKSRGFTLVEIMMVVAIIGLLVAIAMPAFLKARTASQQAACINNLRQIDFGKSNYSLEAGYAASSLGSLVPTYIKREPVCPAGGAYAVNPITTEPTCSVAGGHSL